MAVDLKNQIPRSGAEYLLDIQVKAWTVESGLASEPCPLEGFCDFFSSSTRNSGGMFLFKGLTFIFVSVSPVVRRY